MPKLTDAMNSIRTCGRKSINLKDKPLMKPAPTALRDYVRNTKARGEEKCMSQLLAVFDCWEKHNQESKPCQMEIETYHTCSRNARLEIKERRKNDRDGVIPLNEPHFKLTSNQKNNLLKRYMQLRPVDHINVLKKSS